MSVLKTAEYFNFLDIKFTTYHWFSRKDGKKAAGNDISGKWQQHNTIHKTYEEVLKCANREIIGLGILCGEASNIFVLDFDDKDLAKDFFSKFPEDKKTMYQETQKGYHFFYEYDKDFHNRQIGLGGRNLDIISGDSLLYHFPNDGYKLTAKEIQPISKEFKSFLLGLEKEEVKPEKKRVDTKEGGRNVTLFKFLSGIQGNQNPEPAELLEAAHAWNNDQSNPLDTKELEKVVKSVSKYEPEGEKPKKKFSIDTEEYQYWYNPKSDQFIEYNADSDEVELEMNKQTFLQYTGLAPKDLIMPNVFHDFNFGSERFYQKGIKQYFNEHKAPKWLGLEKVKPENKNKALFDRYFMHLGCNDEKIADYVMQWVAYLYQTGTTPRTAILMRGVQGTGKGTLFNLLAHLFNPMYITRLSFDLIKTGYNDFLVRNRVLFVDEMPDNEVELQSFSNSLKTYVTDQYQTINKKYQPIYDAEVNAAFIVASNFNRALSMDESDRRWTVLPYNQTPILGVFNKDELEILNGPEIAEEFAKYLSCVKVDKKLVETPMNTEAKEILKQDTVSVSQKIVNALIDKDLEFFIENIQSEKLLSKIHTCFEKSKIPTAIIIEILISAGKTVNSYTVNNILRRTQFYELFQKSKFRLGDLDGYGTKVMNGYTYKNIVHYDIEYINGEISTKLHPDANPF
jgi:hypothetical protein